MELSREQLTRIVYTYSRNLHDFSFAPQIQTMCSKLLLNLIDCITQLHNKDREEGLGRDDGWYLNSWGRLRHPLTRPPSFPARGLLMKILDAFASKFTSIHVSLPLISRYYGKKKTAIKRADAGPGFVPEPEMFLEYEYMHPIKAYLGPYDQSQDVIKGKFYAIYLRRQS
jgi:transformation/transcription domain-associated protein